MILNSKTSCVLLSRLLEVQYTSPIYHAFVCLSVSAIVNVNPASTLETNILVRYSQTISPSYLCENGDPARYGPYCLRNIFSLP